MIPMTIAEFQKSSNISKNVFSDCVTLTYGLLC